MNPFKRGAAPPELVERGAGATEAFVARRQRDPSARFEWPRGLYPVLRSALGALTLEHCAYCDGFPIDTTGTKEIDHFRPKSRFPAEAFDWVNLYLTCNACNGEKGEAWSQHLLRPDDPSYAFERYFMIDALTGRVKANPAASEADQKRADETIRTFGLQRDGLCIARRMAIASKERQAGDPHRPYRFLEP